MHIKQIKLTKFRRKLVFISNNCPFADGLLSPIFFPALRTGLLLSAPSGPAPNQDGVHSSR
ncbi:MAG: hypothetical protein B6I20_07095 [Bacteroidetes bacterium 4572_117]|nr:MAG: hypothetical protein B6I20_07095 [Bacteroidetes bacterium 4572_117]